MTVSYVRGRARKHGASSGMVAPPQRRSAQPTRKRVGIQDLPVELFGEILSHFPSVRFEMLKPSQEDFELAANRRVTLIALSQTCGYLRDFFLPYAYDAIQVFTGFNTGNYKYLPAFDANVPGTGKNCAEHLFAKELIRQIQGVTVRNQTLAHHVKSLDVTILGYKQPSIIKELFRCMKRLPNLANVYINVATGSSNLQEYIGRYNFQQVNSLRISQSAQRLIHCFPNLRHLGMAGNDFTGIMYQYYLVRFHNLESISIPFINHYDVANIAMDMPNLHSITLNYSATLSYISRRGEDQFWPKLAKLSQLQVIRVNSMPENVWRNPKESLLDAVMDNWVNPALETLRKTKGGTGKRKQPKKLVLRWERKMRTFFLSE